MAQFKALCMRCKKNYIVTTGREQYPVCYPCQKKTLDQPITDPAMKKLFDIPEEFYEKNSFLRNIKVAYIRYGSLSERQIEAFKESVERMKENAQ